MKKTHTVFYIRGIPCNIKANFKAWCAKRGSSMTEELIKFMEEKSQRAEQNKLEIEWVKKGRV